MSIINQMLKDIKHHQSQNIVEFITEEPIQTHKKIYFFVIVVFVLLLLDVFLKSHDYKEKDVFNKKNNTTQQVKENQVEYLAEKNTSIHNAEKKSISDKVLIKNTVVKSAESKIEEKTKEYKRSKTQSRYINHIAQSKSSKIRLAFKTIQSDYFSHGYSQIKPILLSFIKNNPNYHKARQYLISVAWKENDPNISQYIHDSVELFPKNSNYLLFASRYYYDSKNYIQARDYLENISSDYSLYAELLKLRGLIQQKLNRHQDAISDYLKIIKLNPRRGDIHLAMAISYDVLGEKSHARVSFINALNDQRLTVRQRQFANKKVQNGHG